MVPLKKISSRHYLPLCQLCNVLNNYNLLCRQCTNCAAYLFNRGLLLMGHSPGGEPKWICIAAKHPRSWADTASWCLHEYYLSAAPFTFSSFIFLGFLWIFNLCRPPEASPRNCVARGGIPSGSWKNFRGLGRAGLEPGGWRGPG